MGVKKDLLINSGKLTEQDDSWDMQFWQSVTTTERFHATYQLLRGAYKIKTGNELPTTVDKQHIIIGSYPHDR